MNMLKPISNLLVFLSIIAFVSSFLFQGFRVASVPISIASLIALIFLPWAPKSYDRTRWGNVKWAMTILIGLALLNAALFGFEARNFLYLLIPLAAIGTVAYIQILVDNYGMLTIQRWAIWLCAVNGFVMLLQATNLAGVNEHFLPLWTANIEFIVANEYERDILLNTFPVRPSGLFPTGIFVSTVIYIVCRGIYLYQRKTWLLLFAFFFILMTTNRTLAVIFVTYESIAMVHVLGFSKFCANLGGLVLIGVFIIAVLLIVSPNLFLFQFVLDEIGGEIMSSNSVVERLKTVEIFLENLPQYGLSGGFSASTLADAAHVFDSELMLRTLQFGIMGVLCLVVVILVPRRGSLTSSWNFLFVLAFLTSLTTTLTTSIVYLVALAYYKECVVRADTRSMLAARGSMERKV
jgi:hypothetical protein